MAHPAPGPGPGGPGVRRRLLAVTEGLGTTEAEQPRLLTGLTGLAWEARPLRLSGFKFSGSLEPGFFKFWRRERPGLLTGLALGSGFKSHRTVLAWGAPGPATVRSGPGRMAGPAPVSRGDHDRT
eukprot:764450-Hanusia_phi.AAC.1